MQGENRDSLGLTGFETYDITGIAEGISQSKKAIVTATAADGRVKKFEVVVRIDTPQEVEYYRNGGILPYVLRQVVGASAAVS